MTYISHNVLFYTVIYFIMFLLYDYTGLNYTNISAEDSWLFSPKIPYDYVVYYLK